MQINTIHNLLLHNRTGELRLYPSLHPHPSFLPPLLLLNLFSFTFIIPSFLSPALSVFSLPLRCSNALSYDELLHKPTFVLYFHDLASLCSIGCHLFLIQILKESSSCIWYHDLCPCYSKEIVALFRPKYQFMAHLHRQSHAEIR